MARLSDDLRRLPDAVALGGVPGDVHGGGPDGPGGAGPAPAPAPSESTPGRRARRFLERMGAVSPYQRREAGLGEQTSAASPSADLTTVTWDGALVHAVAVNRRHELVAA